MLDFMFLIPIIILINICIFRMLENRFLMKALQILHFMPGELPLAARQLIVAHHYNLLL